MGLGLSNARLNVAGSGAQPPVQRVKPARTSIAEDAIFIPKPHKRVDFKMSSGGGTGELKMPGQDGGKADVKSIPLPGQAADNGGGALKPLGAGAAQTVAAAGSPDAAVSVTGQNIASGEFGAHGLTAEFDKGSYMVRRELVKVEYSSSPEKDFNAIAPQEEGRQTNHAKQVHYTQQYDAYGRPRIGFSREPYDFAATKYMVRTAQLKFEQNMQSTQQSYEKYSDGGNAGSAAPQAAPLSSNGANAPTAPNEGMVDKAAARGAKGMIDPEDSKGPKGMIDPATVAEGFLGADKTPTGELVSSDPKQMETLGGAARMQKGMVDPNQSAGAQKPDSPPAEASLLKGESVKAVAEKMGMRLDAVMTPSTAGPRADAAPAPGAARPSGSDASLGGKGVREVAAMMGMNISAVLAASPEKVAKVHSASQLSLGGAAVSVSA